jgi:hypothetical protein
MRMPNNSITQSTGIGHAIHAEEHAHVYVGDLVITSLSSRDLIRFTKKILLFITHRDWYTAETYLESLNSVSSLNDECKNLLKLLKYRISIYQDKEKNIDQDLFIELLRSPHSDATIKDIVESIYIHHLSTISKENAISRYEKSKNKGSYTEEIFLETLANKGNLLHFIDSETSEALEHELCASIRCAIRCKAFQLATDLAEELKKRYKNENSKILLSTAKAYQIHEDIGGRHHWTISQKLMENLNERINECIELKKDSNDNRVVHIAAILLSATWFQHSTLIEICLEKIKEAEKVAPRIGEFILPADKEDISTKSTIEILKKTESSIDESNFSQILYALAEGEISNRDVKVWLENGGKISESDAQKLDFIEISIISISCEEQDKQKKLYLSKRLDFFLENHEESLSNLNILSVHQLCQNLKRIGLPLYTIKLIEPLIPDSPWASPALDVYAEALLESDQTEKLDNLINRMNGVDESFSFIAIKIERELSLENLEKAIDLVEKALKKYKNYCYFWSTLLRVLYVAKPEQPEINDVISRIPHEILERYSDDGFTLLHLIAKTDLALAESFILEWFIDNPVKMAVNITNFHFYTLDQNRPQIEKQYPSKRCSTAVVYSSGNRNFTKLLVNSCSQSEYLLSTDSPLGEFLRDQDVGAEIKLGFTDYKIIEKIQPIVGAFRISTNVRNDMNPGTDCFYQLSVESDGVEDILNHIESITQKKELLSPEINGNSIPILMRLNETHNSNLVRGAFLYLLDEDSNKTFKIPSNGDENVDSVVLDVLSLSYLALTGFCHGLLRTGVKLYITRETKDLVSEWLYKTGRPNYLSIAKIESGFIKTTADDVKKDESYKNLCLLLDNCIQLSSKSIDIPEMIIKIRDIVDISHYSSIKASISHSIPLLCLDSMLCSYYQQLNISLANTSKLIINANLASNHNEKRHAECHVRFGLPVPLVHQDVIMLCQEKGYKQYLAAEIIKSYPNNYHSSDIALQVLTGCCLKSICSAYLGIYRQLGASDWRYTEHIVYACCESAMVCLDGESSEHKIATLIYQVMHMTSSTNQISELALSLFNQFISGHFLDVKEINKKIISIYKSEKPKISKSQN